jgi:ribosomal protein S1
VRILSLEPERRRIQLSLKNNPAVSWTKNKVVALDKMS